MSLQLCTESPTPGADYNTNRSSDTADSYGGCNSYNVDTCAGGVTRTRYVESISRDDNARAKNKLFVLAYGNRIAYSGQS